jgi:hypothetical protein
MSAKRFDRWIRAYVAAWRTDDSRAIGALFSARAVYATGPFDKPWRGRAAIVAAWVARGDSQIRWRFRHRVVAALGSVGIIEGTTTYPASGGRPPRIYGNLWFVRLNRRGEAEEFREWWMQKPA